MRPGDLVGSGTVGTGCLLEVRDATLGRYLEPGDEVTLRVERLGALRTPIVERPAMSEATARAAPPETDPAVAPLPRRPGHAGLVVDLDRAEANARRMGEAPRREVSRLRPHVKTHKSVALARLQLDAGVRRDHGRDARRGRGHGGRRHRRHLHRLSGLGRGPEGRPAPRASTPGRRSSSASTRRRARIASPRRSPAARSPLRVLVEIDSGARRTGVAESRTRSLPSRGGARDAGLVVIGVFTHGGHGYRAPEARVGAAADEVATLGAAADALRADGFTLERISAGSTPTGVLAAAGQVNEIRPGTYLLGDRQQVVLGSIPADGIALVVAATVVSTVRRRPGRARRRGEGADEGSGDVPRRVRRRCRPTRTAVIERLFDYHGAVAIPPGAAAPTLGEIVAIVPNHVCPVVDLFDDFVVTPRRHSRRSVARRRARAKRLGVRR